MQQLLSCTFFCSDRSNQLLIFFFAGEQGIVAGWGRLSEGGQLPNILQYVSWKRFPHILIRESFNN